VVNVTLRDGAAVFEPRGWSKLWTFRRRIVVPLSAIRSVRQAPPGIGRGWWKGWRLPGTHLPGVIVAGSYLRDGDWEFWDVRGEGDRAIEVELRGAPYRRLIADVADPAAVVDRLRAAVARGGAQPT
jgi:hypothetical protein